MSIVGKTKICSVEGCFRKYRYRSPQILCAKHWRRWSRTGQLENTIWHKPAKTMDGYIRVHDKESGERKLQHRLIMERKLGRKLRADEQIHHKNGIRDDNRPVNLEIMSPSEHSKRGKRSLHNWKEIEIILLPKTNRKNKDRKQECLIKDCLRIGTCRGLCESHFSGYFHWKKRNSLL